MLDDVTEIEKLLSVELGYQVAVDKLANIISVQRVVRQGVALVSVTERELLAGDALELLRDRISERTKPKVLNLVLVPNTRTSLPVQGPLESLTEGKSVVYEDHLPLSTFCSKKWPEACQDLALNELVEFIESMGNDITVVAREPGIRSWSALVGSQVWFDGAVVRGRWVWDGQRLKKGE